MIDALEMHKENQRLRYGLEDVQSENDRLSSQIWEDVRIIRNLHYQTRVLLISSVVLVLVTASSLGYLYATVC